MPIRAVAFDVDGTLYPNSRMYLKSIPFLLGHFRLVRAYQKVRRDVREYRPIPDLRSLEHRLLAEEMHIDEARAATLVDGEIHGEWESVFARVRPYRHVREAIEEIKRDGLRVAVSSDFPVERKLKRLGLHDLFECLLWSGDSGYLKPHPEPFNALVECFGGAAHEVLYVGNSYEYDVVGAKNAGMMAAHLRWRPRRDTVADVTFHDYRRLAEWIRTFNREQNRP